MATSATPNRSLARSGQLRIVGSSGLRSSHPCYLLTTYIPLPFSTLIKKVPLLLGYRTRHMPLPTIDRKDIATPSTGATTSLV